VRSLPVLLCSPKDDASFPNLETAFKKCFEVFDDKQVSKKAKIIVACTIAASRPLNDLKFDPEKPMLLNWLKQEKAFLECDDLGLNKVSCAGHFAKMSPCLFHRATHKTQITDVLQSIVMDDEEVASFDEEQCSHVAELAKKGEDFLVKIPDFELETWKTGCGEDEQCASTDAI